MQCMAADVHEPARLRDLPVSVRAEQILRAHYPDLARVAQGVRMIAAAMAAHALEVAVPVAWFREVSIREVGDGCVELEPGVMLTSTALAAALRGAPTATLFVVTIGPRLDERVTELFELVQSELRRSGYQELLSSGIVLTGGSSVMLGMIELGEEIFHMPVRLGIPKYAGGLSEVVQHPRYATAMGLLLEGMAQKKRGIQAHRTRTFRQVLGNMKSWFEKNF